MDRYQCTLREYVAKHGAFDAKSAATIAHVLAGALAQVHAKGVLHRDIKLENVMLTASGLPVLIDFGPAARARGAMTSMTTATATTATATGTSAKGPLGTTLLYAAPELVANRDSAEPSAKADVYAFAYALFELLLGKPVHEFDRKFDPLQVGLNAYRPQLPSSWPASLRALIAECWAQKPDDRPTTAELETRLRLLEKELGVTDREAASLQHEIGKRAVDVADANISALNAVATGAAAAATAAASASPPSTPHSPARPSSALSPLASSSPSQAQQAPLKKMTTVQLVAALRGEGVCEAVVAVVERNQHTGRAFLDDDYLADEFDSETLKTFQIRPVNLKAFRDIRAEMIAEAAGASP
jgi:serine/threonine protein kinase